MKQSENERIGKAINEAAKSLPDFWGIVIEIERGAASVRLVDPENDFREFDTSYDALSDEIRDALDEAKRLSGDDNEDEE